VDECFFRVLVQTGCQREVLASVALAMCVIVHCGFTGNHILRIPLNSACQAIMAEGKQHALGVGLTKMSTTDMYFSLQDFKLNFCVLRLVIIIINRFV